VLLADDDPSFREALTTLLEVDPLVDVVGIASNGAEAVELATSLSPDIVIMDISMPQMDGFEATRRIHQLDGAPVVLMLTASDAVEDVDRARSAGASGFLKKRNEIVELVGLIVSFTSLVGHRPDGS
jgi:DNA-binding NarL/FixJ family response regulator